MITELLIAAQIVWSGPRLSPEEAARILAQSSGLSNRTDAPPPADGPTVVILGSSPTAGPFGEFKPFPPPRRLDGTLLSQPPWRARIYAGRSFATPKRGDRDRSDLRSQIDRPIGRR